MKIARRQFCAMPRALTPEALGPVQRTEIARLITKAAGIKGE